MSLLGQAELERLRNAACSYLSLPTSTDLASDASEEIFAYAVQGTTASKLTTKKRSKLLFDVLRGTTGWSLKTYMPSRLESGAGFEVVLARAAVESKSRRNETGPTIDIATATPEEVGAAVLAVRREVLARSMEKQQVDDPREAFILRSKDNRQFRIFEHPLTVEPDSMVEWCWSNADRLGLQGRVDGQVAYRWYQSGGQLFGIFEIPGDAQIIELDWFHMEWDQFVKLILAV